MSRKNQRRLYRDTGDNWLLGVCSGLAHYFGVSIGVTRLAWLMLSFMFLPLMLVLYFALAFVLPKQDLSHEDAAPTEQIQRRLTYLEDEFADNEARLRRLEAYVTSDDFQFQRKLWDLQENE